MAWVVRLMHDLQGSLVLAMPWGRASFFNRLPSRSLLSSIGCLESSAILHANLHMDDLAVANKSQINVAVDLG